MQTNYRQCCGQIEITPDICLGESFNLLLCWSACSQTYGTHNINVSCNSVSIYSNKLNCVSGVDENGLVDTINVTNNDTVIVCIDALADAPGVATTSLCIQTVSTTENETATTFVIGKAPTYQNNLIALAINKSGILSIE